MRTIRYDYRKSSNDTVHDVRHSFAPGLGVWVLKELISRPDETLLWRFRIEAGTASSYGRLVTFRDERSAADAAATIRESLSGGRAIDRLAENGQSSLALKVSKAVVSFQRHADEEAMMLAEAKRRHAQDPPPSPEEIVILKREYSISGTTMIAPPFDPTPYRAEIVTLALDMPYLRRALAGPGGIRALFTSPDGKTWTLQTYRVSERMALVAQRAQIAQGFGLSELENWATTKGEIRRMLLPRANQLLQLASVRRLLDEALAAGNRALVIGPYVFWYEPDGGLGWLVKELGTAKGGGHDPDGDATWEQGVILSKNHGRVIVLPFRKANGDCVTGYTRNVAGDGPAKPRHPTQYVEVPFKRLDRDLMVGLFGELPYE